ncbi:MAG TPA: hypothetical protein VFJ30_18670 [Phycisphaerae bacterium]|nr:hypothetical protein [Phycisphaerae bacterium]
MNTTAIRWAAWLAVLAAGVQGAWGQTSRPVAGAGEGREVLAFYYPWYGLADGASGTGKVFHWGEIDAARKDISQSRHYPLNGAYDSHDPRLINRHCGWAKQAGIDAWIVSWWGHGTFCDKAMPKVLDGCARNGMTACIYYETVPGPQTPASAARDVVRVLERYGGHKAYLKVDGKPVVFVYGRPIEQIGLAGWAEAIRRVRQEYKGGAFFVGDSISARAAFVFDGIHTYCPAGHMRGMELPAALEWARGSCAEGVRLADRRGRIATATVIPGYDDTKIRKPGLTVGRHESRLYAGLWEAAIAADPPWVLITSFNEWHEGSEIEPSAEDGQTYLELTARFARQFKARPRRPRPPAEGQVPAAAIAQLRDRLKGVSIAVLPGPESVGYFWLLGEVGAPMRAVTWADVAGGTLRKAPPDILLHAGGEDYQPTVKAPGDVDAALAAYMKSGGCMVFLPSMPWPLFYDADKKVVTGGRQLGLHLRMGWERPPEKVKPVFETAEGLLPSVPRRFAFPAAGDVRWRPFDPTGGRYRRYVSLITLRDGEGGALGDAAVYAEPADGGRLLYLAAPLLETGQAEAVLLDVFTRLADDSLRRAGKAGEVRIDARN